ncbi:MAG: 7,8-didemethyl-8-hydroxy-5-deazariboflavin synthase subunit CofG [Xenococcaceae cyanobacterium]
MSRKITYSSAYTLVPTYECFNRCTYCNFRTNPREDDWLTASEARECLIKLKLSSVTEILVLSGEVHPLSARRKDWLERIENLCKLSLSLGFLPHTNVGPLSWWEMKQLKQVNVSMGLMLEQLTPELLKTVHRHAPSKQPELRLQQLEWAGKLKIPFTTGILLGIGETKADCWSSLEAIANIQEKWGHIQEIIIQPYSLGNKQQSNAPGFNLNELPNIIVKAREILPDSIVIQIPPNLVFQPSLLLDCLEAGARDLGGISPKDEVNPDYPHPTVSSLRKILEPADWQLFSRLPVYPQYYSWLSAELQQAIRLKIKNQKTGKVN